jgi:hypothetical protein
MQFTLNIPDSLYRELTPLDSSIEQTVVHALEVYAKRKKASEGDSFHRFNRFIQTPVNDREGRSDVSERHDAYLHGFDK